jgi:predicted secreted protein
MKKSAFVLLLFAFITSCAGGANKVLTDDDNGKHVKLATGEKFELRLKSQLSTGFSWKIVSLKGIARQGDSKVVSVPVDNNVGGQDIQILNFTASEKGEGQIELHYLQQFKEGAQYEKRFFVSFTVE